MLDNTDCDDSDENEIPGQTWYEDADRAISNMQNLLARHPDLPTLHLYLWEIAATNGRFETAVDASRNYFRLVGEPETAAILGRATDETRYRELMREAALELEQRAARPYIANVNLAAVRMHAGDHDAAMSLLEEALRQQESQIVYTVANPIFAPLWRTDRFRALRERIGL